tara:strand:- start:690 stop:1157 length:468 start_codon:yes stop_codon:yes gene_type:complete
MKNILFYCFLALTITASAQRNKLKNIYSENGKIGIGTNSPDELLTVKGKIHTQEVIVDLNGAIAPDFVFEKYFNSFSVLNPEYKFPTLYEIETFIKENHHLPKIPSAQEIEENGLSLKEMNLLLLEKIEELTLFTIQQQKEIDLLKEKTAVYKRQ